MTESRDPAGLPPAARFVVATVLACGAGVVGVLGLWFIDSEPTTTGLLTLSTGSPLLAISAAAGASVGAVLAWGIAGRHRRAIWTGALVGALPALAVCTSYATRLL